MKKILSILLALSIIFAMSLTVFADTDKNNDSFPKVTDRADLLSSSEEEQLEKTFENLSEYHVMDICVRTVNNTGDKSIEAYADDFYERHYGENGVLLLVDIGDRELWISTAGKGIDAFTDYGIDQVLDTIAPYFTDMMYAEGFTEFSNQADRLLVSYEQGSPIDVPQKEPVKKSFDYATAIAIALVLGLLIGFVVANSQKATLKTVRRKYAAAEYRDEGSFFLTDSRDMFLYHTINRIPRPKIEEHNMGGGMMGGSTTHMSGGGMMHGGGGRGF